MPIHRTYTPELLANGRRRYEETPEEVSAIAADFRIVPGSLRRLAGLLGWVRFNMAPRQLPVASRLLAKAEELERRTLSVSRHPEERARRASKGDGQGLEDCGRSSFEGRLRRPPQDDGESLAAASQGDGDNAAPENLAADLDHLEREVRARAGERHRAARAAQRPAAAGARRRKHRAHALQPDRDLAETSTACVAALLHRTPKMTTCPPISMNSVTNLRDALERSSQAGLLEAMLSETADLRRWLKFDSDFVALAHRHQEPPAAANNGGPWTTWLMLGGRGAGKTRAGAEWLRAQALRPSALCGRAARATSRWSARPGATCAR